MTPERLKVIKAWSIYTVGECRHNPNCGAAASCLAECVTEIERLRGTLNKAEVVLLNYTPADPWFPQIEMQFSELLDEIHNRLKNKAAKE